MTAELTLFGEILQALLDRAEVSGPAELAQRMHEEGNYLISEEILIELMYGTYKETGEEKPELAFGGGGEVLDMNKEEVALMAEALIMDYEPSSIEAQKLWWKVKRAMARRQITPLEELTEEEAFSETKLWWKVEGCISNARFNLERRWVFGEEGEELIRELAELEDKARQLSQRVGQQLRVAQEGAA